MRRISAMAVLGLLVAAQGCTINIPGNLLTQITATPKASSTPPPASACDATFSALDVNQDQFLTETEFNASPQGDSEPKMPGTKVPSKGESSRFVGFDRDGDGLVSRGEYLQGCGETTTKASPKPSARPSIAPGPFFGMESCDHALKKFDTDGDGRLSPGEFAVWQMGFQPPTLPTLCAEPQVAIVGNNGAAYEVMRTPVMQTPPPNCAPPAPVPMLPPFEKWDRDRSQFIERAELCEGGVAVPPLPPRPTGCEETFKHADRNADGTISPEEYFTGDFAPPPPDGLARPAVMPTEGELAARFKALDLNADGRLDLREFCAGWGGPVVVASAPPTPRPDDCEGLVKSYDRNQDGKVTWEEYYEGFLSPISARYDGQKDEIYARFKGLDVNGDGVLTSDEFCAQPSPTPTPMATKQPDDLNR